MALSIVTDFVGTPLAAAPPFTVSFTDLSVVVDGFKRLWFWEFGDGTVSTTQNPTHEYDGVGGETFNVKLTVLVTSGEFDILIISINNAISAGGSTERNGTSLISEAEAWQLFNADAGTGGSLVNAVHQLVRTGGTDRQYKNIISNISVVTSIAQVDGTINLLTCNPSDFEIFLGSVNAGPNSVGYGNNDTRQFHHLVEGVVASVPIPFTVSVTPVSQLPDTLTTNQQHGLNVSFTLLTYIVGTSQTSDTERKNQYITIGTPPVAAFNGFPKSGPSPLLVQFENLSVPATGAETTYSWKKRLSGTADPFVQFSAAENPLVSFSKV